ncbi:MAG: DUF1573 domain-containing protein [Bacteroidota bacterium]
MKKITGLYTIISIISFQLSAQQIEDLNFSEITHDFGNIQEEDGPVTHEFVFTNNSDKPVKILNVRASCGCTTPDWSKEPVAPGENGFIQAQYNPKNRPGSFSKSLTITTDLEDLVVRLFIKGNVTPKVKSIDEELNVVLGGIRVKYRGFNMQRVKTTDTPTVREFDVYNSSDTIITFLDKLDGPDHIKVSFVPQALSPKQKGKIFVTYNGKSRNDLGFMSDNVTFYTDEKESPGKSISVYATIEEYFPPMTQEQLAMAPHLNIADNTHDFGKVLQGKKVSTKFTLTNSGKSDLNIRKVKANCGCTISKLEKEDLKPGESTAIKVTFDSKNRRGNQQKSVTIYSNDPTAPTQRVTIKAVVTQTGS